MPEEVDPNIVTGVVRKPFEVADLGSIIRLCVSGFDEAAHRQAMPVREPAAASGAVN